MKKNEAVEIAYSLWRFFNETNWQEARKLLNDDFKADWPQPREQIIGPDNFIELNRTYPGTHQIKILNYQHSYDCWEQVDKVVTQVHIKSQMPDGKNLDLFAISFFKIREGKIIEAVEYWADSYPAPEWRKKFVNYY